MGSCIEASEQYEAFRLEIEKLMDLVRDDSLATTESDPHGRDKTGMEKWEKFLRATDAEELGRCVIGDS